MKEAQTERNSITILETLKILETHAFVLKHIGKMLARLFVSQIILGLALLMLIAYVVLK